MKKVLKIIAIILCIIILIYVSISCYFGLSVKKIAYEINENNGVISNAHIKDPDIIRSFDMRWAHGVDFEEFETSDKIKENYTIWFIPICWYNFSEGTVFYYYTYTLYVNDELRGGSTQIPVTLKLEFDGFNWCIVDHYEPL